MSRSRRKTPKGPITTAQSEKEFKRQTNKVFRAKERTLLRKLQEDPEDDIEAHLPNKPHEVVEEWSGPKDGKNYFGDYPDKKLVKKWMRK